jgi:putative addiction module antidote
MRGMFAVKVTTIGNSVGIVLPRDVLSRLRVEKGDQLFLVESPLGFELTPYEPGFARQMEMGEQVARVERDVIRQIGATPRLTAPKTNAGNAGQGGQAE